MASTMLRRMRALRMGDGEEPTSAPWPSAHSSRQEARMRVMRRGPMALGRGRGNNNNGGGSAPPSYSGWPSNVEPASPITSSEDEDEAREEERYMDREREEATLPHAADNSIIDTFSDVEREEEEEEQEELTAEPETAEERAVRMRSYETMTVDEYDGRLRQSSYQRPDTPRYDEEVVDEDETERARQAGVREGVANWANMHLQHYREGTMTWEELLEELRREGPQ